MKEANKRRKEDIGQEGTMVQLSNLIKAHEAATQRAIPASMQIFFCRLCGVPGVLQAVAALH